MTLDEAVEALNYFRYRGMQSWVGRDEHVFLMGEALPRYSTFEAIAIAEKLLRYPEPGSLKGMIDIVCALMELTANPLNGENRCLFCDSEHIGLQKFPHDPKFHLPGCMVPRSRSIVSPPDLCPLEELEELLRLQHAKTTDFRRVTGRQQAKPNQFFLESLIKSIDPFTG